MARLGGNPEHGHFRQYGVGVENSYNQVLRQKRMTEAVGIIWAFLSD